MKEKEDLILRLSFDYAIQIIKISKKLNAQGHYTIANQMVRSGTSIGANIRESKHAESRADFIHKLKISAKEAYENEYWLLICKELNLIDCEAALNDIQVILRILSKSISTAKKG